MKLEFTDKFVKGTVLFFHLTLSPKPGTIWQQDEDKNFENFLKIQEWNGPDSVSLPFRRLFKNTRTE